MILIYQQLHHQTPSESFRVKHPASHWQTCQKGEMAPGPAGIHVPRAPRNCNRQGVGGQSKPQAGGWCSFSGRKGTDRRWYQQDHTCQPEMIPSDIDTGDRDSRPPTAETTPVQSEEKDSGEEIQVSMVADMGGGGG